MTLFKKIMSRPLLAMMLLCTLYSHGTCADARPEAVLPAISILLLSESVEPVEPVDLPANLFNIGDSIGVGQAANNNIFALALPEHVWSTGYQSGDAVFSLNERFEALGAGDFRENSENRNPVFNHAFSGGVMADFAAQAQGVVVQAGLLPEQKAGMVAVLMGNNDVCTEEVDEPMISTAVFETQLRAGLDVLANSPATSEAVVHVSGIPAIYWLWEARKDTLLCPAIWTFVPCQNLLGRIDASSPEDDCASVLSSQTPDLIFSGDGPNCRNRKAFHAAIRDDFNPVLEAVVAEYRASDQLPNAMYVDLFDVKFETAHVNSGDCFHPSIEGHALLARKHWCRSPWGRADPSCAGE